MRRTLIAWLRLDWKSKVSLTNERFATGKGMLTAWYNSTAEGGGTTGNMC